MKIDIPYDIGDPILVIDFCQHDGYYIDCRPWNSFCDWIESLPYAELITGKEK